MCRVDGLGRALLVCVVTSFVCRACLSRLGERELVPRLTRAVSRAGLRSPRPQARGPRGAQGDADQGVPHGVEDHDPVVCVCRVDGVVTCCLCVVVVCRARVSRLDERTRSATHPGGFAQAPARPPRHARGRRHDRPGAPDGRHALLSAAREDGLGRVGGRRGFATKFSPPQ